MKKLLGLLFLLLLLLLVSELVFGQVFGSVKFDRMQELVESKKSESLMK